jgi:hypothetical protein
MIHFLEFVAAVAFVMAMLVALAIVLNPMGIFNPLPGWACFSWVGFVFVSGAGWITLIFMRINK